MSDDPVIAALERCALPDGITSIDAQAVAGIVRARLARFGTPEQQARMLDELGDGTATFALVDMRGDYVLLMNNPETYGTREVGQFSRSSVDEQGRLSSFWTMTVHGPWLEPPTAGPVIAAFAGWPSPRQPLRLSGSSRSATRPASVSRSLAGRCC